MPQLSWTGGGGVEVPAAGREDGIAVRQFVSVHNDGWVDATVTGLALPELAGVQWGVEGMVRAQPPSCILDAISWPCTDGRDS